MVTEGHKNHNSRCKFLKGNNRRKKPIHFVLDEARLYINKKNNYVLKENIFEKIAREGRIYFLFLLVFSQRPSELSETVLSQCGNFVIHRIQNEIDMRHIQTMMPFYSEDLTIKIRQSSPGEAVVLEYCVSMPFHLKIHRANPSPNSEYCMVAKEWFRSVDTFH